MKAPRRHAALTAIMAMVAGLLTVGPLAGTAAAALPENFVLRDMATGLTPADQFTDFAYLPDESILVTGKHGKINWLPRSGAPRPLGTIPTHSTGDIGLLGIAVAPDYDTSRTVYTARTVSATGPGTGENGAHRVSAWTVTTDTAGTPTGLTGERVILSTSADYNVHGMSGLVAAQDGTIWVSIGDGGDFTDNTGNDWRAHRARNIDDLHGKLLHVNTDGTGVASNPYYNGASPRVPRSMVYASGFRSPFRFTLEPATGRPVLGDVGHGTWEEVNLVTPGNSYGWPCWEANSQVFGFRDNPQCAGSSTASPLWSYPHAGSPFGNGASITGGVIYTGSSYPERFRGRYFFADYVDRRMWSLAFNEQGQITTPAELFGNEIGNPVKFGTVPTGGDLVYADIGTGKLRRLVYSLGNEPPTAAITSTNDAATRTVTLDATESRDPNGDRLTYAWDFGDGQTGTGERVTHTYAAGQDSFEVKLTVKDESQATGTATATVHPSNHAPTLSLTAPDPAARYAVGDVVTASATATDPEDGPVEVTWNTVTVHCYTVGDCHHHGGGLQQGPQYRLTFLGHPGDSRVEVTATVKDRLGATTTKMFVIRPKQRRVTISSNVPAAFTIGDEETSSTLFTVGTQLTLSAPEKALDNVATFSQWGDGTTQRARQLTLPDADQVWETIYQTPIDHRYATDADLRARVGAPVDVEQGDANVRWRVYERGRVYWSPASGAHSMNGAILTWYLGHGGHLSYGLPSEDEQAGSAGGGRVQTLTRGQKLYWHSSTGAHLVGGAILTRYKELGAEGSGLGYPTSDEGGAPDGRFNHFQRGSIYWTPTHGAHELFGAILNRWAALGGATHLGFPITNESDAAAGGRYEDFQRGTIYWHPNTGAWEVIGAIRNRWNQLGKERSYLGYPIGGEEPVTGGRRSKFQHGYIMWHSATGQVTDHRY